MPKTSKPADRTALIEAIEHALTSGLTHRGTGDGPIALPLPMFNNSTMPDEMARHFAEDAGLPHANVAKLVAEALVDAIEGAGESNTANAIRQAAPTIETPVPASAPAPEPAPAPQTPPAGEHLTATIVTVNGQTVMTKLEDLQKFTADVQPGSRPPLWKKILIMAALDGVTHQAFRRLDITTEDDGSWTVRGSAA